MDFETHTPNNLAGTIQLLQSPEQVLDDPKLFYSRRSELKDDYNGLETIFHLSQLQWLGFNYSDSNDSVAIEKYIKHIVPVFNVAFLTDQFDASLVRMKRRFCWDHADILYMPQEVGGRYKNMKPHSNSSLPLSSKGIK